MRIRQVTLAIGLLLAASASGLLLSTSIAIIAGLAEFTIPYDCGGGILTDGPTYPGCPPYVPPLDMNQVADVWAVLGFVVICASIGGLASLFLGREFARPLILGVASSVVFASILSWWSVLWVFSHYSYYSIPSIYIMLPFASLLIWTGSVVAMTIWIVQSRVPMKVNSHSHPSQS